MRIAATLLACAALYACGGDGPTGPGGTDGPQGGEPAPRPVRYVDAGRGDDRAGANTCEEPTTPCVSLAHAIASAAQGDSVAIADGVYTESLTIDKSLALAGQSEAGTIIQAHEQNGQARARVITIVGEPAVMLADLTIRHGNAAGAPGAPEGWGGGLYDDGAELTLSRVTFERNGAQQGGGVYHADGALSLDQVTFVENAVNSGGGGLYVLRGTTSLSGVTFERNLAFSGGGGMYAADSSPTLVDVVFTRNRGVFFAGGLSSLRGSPTLRGVTFDRNEAPSGAGMRNADGSPTLTDVTFTGNVAANSGGGMYTANGALTLEHVEFIENEARGSDEHGGGGLHSDGSTLTLTDVSFEENFATMRGGGMLLSGGAAAFDNARFLENEAGDLGGGLFVEQAAPRMRNVVFWANSGRQGGGLFNWTGGRADLVNVTLAENVAQLYGGGVASFSNDPMSLWNCIVWGNRAGEGDEIAVGPDALVRVFYSVIDSVGDGVSVLTGGGLRIESLATEDPAFVDAGGADLHLEEGSAAIEAGDPGTDLGIFARDEDGGPIDLDGSPRLVGERIDAGAYERQGG